MEIRSPSLSLFLTRSFLCFSSTKLRPGIGEMEWGWRGERWRYREKKAKRRPREKCGSSEVYKVVCVYSGDATSASEWKASILFSTVIWNHLTLVHIDFYEMFSLTSLCWLCRMISTVQCWDIRAGQVSKLQKMWIHILIMHLMVTNISDISSKVAVSYNHCYLCWLGKGVCQLFIFMHSFIYLPGKCNMPPLYAYFRNPDHWNKGMNPQWI